MATGKSPASAAYLERLDDLIKHLQNTYDAAVANYSAFNSATSALADSRRKLKVVYDAYVANKGKIDAYDERMAKGNPGGGTSVARFTAPPPVTDQQQEQLTNQARSIMYGLSTEISQAHAGLIKPAEYDPARPWTRTVRNTAGRLMLRPSFRHSFLLESRFLFVADRHSGDMGHIATPTNNRKSPSSSWASSRRGVTYTCYTSRELQDLASRLRHVTHLPATSSIHRSASLPTSLPAALPPVTGRIPSQVTVAALVNPALVVSTGGCDPCPQAASSGRAGSRPRTARRS